MSEKINNKKCKTCESIELMEGRKICKECYKQKKHIYYLNNKDKFESKYICTGKKRGRPIKKLDIEIIV